MPFFGVPIRNGLPIGLGSVAGFGVQQFDPSQLFEGGTVAGAWYDPSDLSTMFTTSAGTTPVAMPGQGAAVPVGLMLDKSQNGVGTNGAKRVNLLTFSEQFDNAAWTKANFNAFGAGSVANTTATLDPLGGNTADYIQENATTNAHQVYSLGGIAVGAGSYRGFIYAKAAERSRLVMGIWDGTNYELCQFDLTNGVILQEATPGIASIESAGNGWWKCGVSRTIGAITTFLSFGPYINANISTLTGPWTNAAYTGTGTSGIYIWGADLRLASEANTLPLYQPITSSWYATLPGNHAISFNNTTARPELRARVNLLTYSEEFDNGAWTKANVTVTANAAVAPDGTTTADLVYPSTSGTDRTVNRALVGGITGVSYRTTICCKAAGVGFAYAYNVQGNQLLYVNLTTGLTSDVGSNISNLSSSIDANGWVTVQFDSTLTSGTTLNWYIGPCDASGSRQVTANGTDGIYIWGADLRPANIGANVPAYQRIADANTYDTSGFPLYLRFDGIDDSMYTPANLNLSGTDKVAVFAGVRKLSDAAQGVVAELSATIASNNGTFLLAAPDGATQTYGWDSKGTTQVDAVASSLAAPRTNVLVGTADIAGDSCIIRVNGAVADTEAGDQGTGNYGTYPLYIGARNNSSLWLNGQLYSLIIAGSAVSAGNISATEQWVAGKTGIQI